jgi:tripeptidyl-peptidase I
MHPSSFLAFMSIGLLQGRAKATVAIESIRDLPLGWTLQGKADGDENIRLSVALKQPRLDDLKANLLRISQTGQHLSKLQLQPYREPSQDAVTAVSDWLESSGVDKASQHEAWITFNTTVERANSLFEAELAHYTFGNSTPYLRTQSYAIPASLAKHIDFVFPLAHFMTPERSRPQPEDPTRDYDLVSNPAPGTACGAEANPACIRQLYNLTYTAPDTNSPSRFGVAGFLDEWINTNDTASFLASQAPAIANVTPAYDAVLELVNNGTNDANRAGSEAALDVQYALALGFPAKVTYYSTGGRGVKIDKDGVNRTGPDSDNEPYVDLLTYLLALDDEAIPHVLSVSYADDEQSVPEPYALRVCDMFAMLVARGVTVLAASGDGGARGTVGI